MMGWNIFKVLMSIAYGIIKAFFKATVEIAWGLASFFLLMGLLTYYKADATAIQNLFPLIEFIQTNWYYFWWAFFGGELYLNIREVNNEK